MKNILVGVLLGILILISLSIYASFIEFSEYIQWVKDAEKSDTLSDAETILSSIERQHSVISYLYIVYSVLWTLVVISLYIMNSRKIESKR